MCTVQSLSGDTFFHRWQNTFDSPEYSPLALYIPKHLTHANAELDEPLCGYEQSPRSRFDFELDTGPTSPAAGPYNSIGTLRLVVKIHALSLLSRVRPSLSPKAAHQTCAYLAIS